MTIYETVNIQMKGLVSRNCSVVSAGKKDYKDGIYPFVIHFVIPSEEGLTFNSLSEMLYLSMTFFVY